MLLLFLLLKEYCYCYYYSSHGKNNLHGLSIIIPYYRYTYRNPTYHTSKKFTVHVQNTIGNSLVIKRKKFFGD